MTSRRGRRRPERGRSRRAPRARGRSGVGVRVAIIAGLLLFVLAAVAPPAGANYARDRGVHRL